MHIHERWFYKVLSVGLIAPSCLLVLYGTFLGAIAGYGGSDPNALVPFIIYGLGIGASGFYLLLVADEKRRVTFTVRVAAFFLGLGLLLTLGGWTISVLLVGIGTLLLPLGATILLISIPFTKNRIVRPEHDAATLNTPA